MEEHVCVQVFKVPLLRLLAYSRDSDVGFTITHNWKICIHAFQIKRLFASHTHTITHTVIKQQNVHTAQIYGDNIHSLSIHVSQDMRLWLIKRIPCVCVCVCACVCVSELDLFYSPISSASWKFLCACVSYLQNSASRLHKSNTPHLASLALTTYAVICRDTLYTLGRITQIHTHTHTHT